MKPEKSFLDSRNEKSYCSWVLIGNWFEDRTTEELNKKDKKQDCDKYLSEYNASFVTHKNDQIKINGSRALKNFRRNTLCRIKLFHSDEFKNNFTRSSDLHYEIIPKDICGPLPTFNKKTGKWEPYPDFLESYGNQTKFGFREYLKRKQAQQEYTGGNVSEFRDNFTCLPKSAYRKVSLKKCNS